MNVPHLAVVVLFLALPLADAAAQQDELSQLSPAGAPLVYRAHGVTVATLFPSDGLAKVVVLRGDALEASSPSFDFPSSANYGAAWIEETKITSASAFIVRFRTRQTCGPGIHDYTFTRQREVWVLTQLHREESRCSEAGVTADWRRTYDFLRGTVTSIRFRGTREHKRVLPAKAPVVPLVNFFPFDARYERDA